MEKITKNLRRIPTGKLLKLKGISFKVYIKLQAISLRNPNGGDKHRYIPINWINKTTLAKELGVTRPTIVNKFKELEKNKLIRFKKINEKEYLILPDKGDFYVLLDLDLIELLLSNCTDHFIKVYLIHKAYCNKYGEHYLKLEQIAKEIGVSTTHLQKIIDANVLLQQLGVLEITKEWKYENGQTREKNKYKILK